MNHKHILLHINLISGIGPATIKKVVESLLPENLSCLYTYTVQDFLLCNISYDRATKLVDGLKDYNLFQAELDRIEKYKISWTTFLCSDYSKLLLEIEQPPIVIYYQGVNLLGYDRSIAFVGSRKADAYARVVVNKLIPSLIDQNWVIVSGGALGVDSLVHEKVITASGKTIVVLGSGLLHWYPHENYRLFSNILDAGGMIISYFSLETKPVASNFPARNRIISGLSQGTVVVQAARKSGALITADFALEQGRQVFAVPGSIEHGLHDGCHDLIQQGAKLVHNVDDITQEFGMVQQVSTTEKAKGVIGSEKAYDKDEIAILEKLLVATSTEDLLYNLQIPLEDLLSKLFNLSMDGKIIQDIMGLWKRV